MWAGTRFVAGPAKGAALASTEGVGSGTHSEIILRPGFFSGAAPVHNVDFSFDVNEEDLNNSTIVMLHELVHTLGGDGPGHDAYWNDQIYEGCFSKNAK